MFSRTVFSSLAAIASASLVVAQFPANCARNHTVVLGDTCNDISAALNVSSFQLGHVNPGINAACSNLFAGEILCLGIIGQDCTTTAVIQPGDFCQEIADDAGIDSSVLFANNPNVDAQCDNILVGEVLCTASNIISYSF